MEELYARIEDYLDGRLDEADRAAFEAALRSDTELAEALALTREARERLARHWAGEASEAALRNTLHGLGDQHFTAPSARPWLLRRWPILAVAAAVTVLLIWVAWPASDARLYARYREFPEASFVVRAGEPGQADIAEAESAFNRGDFATALPLLERRLQAKSDDLEARFFLALCQMELGRSRDAIAGFQQIMATPNSWAGEARWFLALTYLKDKNREECAATLRGIQAGDAHEADARRLLKALGK